MYSFIIPGEAKGKGRPKFARMGNFVKTYTPKDTANYESLVKLYFTEAYPEWQQGIISGAIKLSVTVQTIIPKSFSKKKTEMALKNLIRPLVKPDADNIIKIIADSLNGIAYQDDKQIVSMAYDKYYSNNPHVWVIIEELNLTGNCS